MDDADAEAPLLALGARLTWEQTDTHRWDGNTFNDDLRASTAFEFRMFYTIVAEPGLKRFVAHVDVDGDVAWNPKFSSSLAAAKAACERHYATGKWE